MATRDLFDRVPGGPVSWENLQVCDVYVLPLGRRSFVADRRRGNEVLECFGFGGFRQMAVEPGFACTLDVLVLTPTGQCHEDHSRAEERAYPARGLVAVHARHPDVEERNLRL